jgi:hypothetical protein
MSLLESSDTSEHPAAEKVSVRNKRSIDPARTLEKYRERLETLSTASLQENLDSRFISTFDVWDTQSTETVIDRGPVFSAFVLLSVAHSRGINVLGVCSARKRNGTLINPAPPGAECVFIGSSVYFTGYRAHPVYSVQKADKVYLAR